MKFPTCPSAFIHILPDLYAAFKYIKCKEMLDGDIYYL